MSLLVADNLSKHYDAFCALREVSFSIDTGEFVAIIGPNGAGKTTLVNLLTGLLKPTTGSVRLKGRDIAGVGPVELGHRGMARAFQLVQVFPTLTVHETLCVGLASRRDKRVGPFSTVTTHNAITREASYVAELFGLTSRLRTPAADLSQGEKKLLDIASAFTLKPDVILLDEPTSGVSTAEKHVVMATLLDAAKSAGIQSIILVEHDMDLVSRYSRRIIAMQEGRILADLPTQAFFSSDDLVALVAGKPPSIAAGEASHAFSA